MQWWWSTVVGEVCVVYSVQCALWLQFDQSVITYLWVVVVMVVVVVAKFE